MVMVQRMWMAACIAMVSLLSCGVSHAQALDGCQSCHLETDARTMHPGDPIALSCVECHGGDDAIVRPIDLAPSDPDYGHLKQAAHVQPRHPAAWTSSANPVRSYTLLNEEDPAFVRFINPGDYRIVRQTCGTCHTAIVAAAERSLMATGAMFWAAAAYNNNVLPHKPAALGEAYTTDGDAAGIKGPSVPDHALREHGVVSQLEPLPPWTVVPSGDNTRTMEAGGTPSTATRVAERGGGPQALQPGRPDVRAGTRARGTGGRTAGPVVNLHKTRLNDPMMWFLGTNDQPGDYRSSGCSACHVVYANSRDPRYGGPYVTQGHRGTSATVDPTIPHDEPGHPIRHEFTRAIPTSQCMSCHMHQPNIFVNSFLGYTMWDYEADAPSMWPEEAQNLSPREQREVLDRNPEGAVVRGRWADPSFMEDVVELNPTLQDTQFADFHGHGWNFRAIFKKDIRGNLLDEDDQIIDRDDPDRFERAVHMSSIHLDKGMHCVDCHFAQDAHGSGYIHVEVAAGIEIQCVDCHGSADAYPTLRTSGPAAPPEGHDLSVLLTADGRRRFVWREGKLYQRAALDPKLEWELSLVADSVNPDHATYNPLAARAKLMSRDTSTFSWGPGIAPDERAHSPADMTCYTCHTAWTTSCAGCHLPFEANQQSDEHHYEGGTSRGFASYNPQVVRDQIFQLGRRGTVKGGVIAPVRSSSALVVSSTNRQGARTVQQQPPVSASGFSSQAFAPHFPHTVRKRETKRCSGCHVAESGENNALMAQLLMLGTGTVGFVGHDAWVGTEGSVAGVVVTEWTEPQAVLGSYLHEYAYPDRFAAHQRRDLMLDEAYTRSTDEVGCLQLRGERLYVAERRGLRVYDVSQIGNKDVAQRIQFGMPGNASHIPATDMSCVALPTTQPIRPRLNDDEARREANAEQAMHPIYRYAVMTDREEGLILTDITPLTDGVPTKNRLQRALTWDGDGLLKGAQHITLGGHIAYVSTDEALVVVDLASPLEPKIASVVPGRDVRASALQFRYLFTLDALGLQTLDVTDPYDARRIEGAHVPLDDARRLHIGRTWAYVAAGKDGLAIVDVTRPTAPMLSDVFTGDGRITDARDVIVASTNASQFAYVADAERGLHVIQLTSPRSQPGLYGFSPEPRPTYIAGYTTAHPATALSRPLERDRGVDETGHQIAVFSRYGSRPFTQAEMHKMFLQDDHTVWTVKDAPQLDAFVPKETP